jgi:predicted oxidoreductase
MWRFAGVGLARGRRLIEAALAADITLFDTADIYGLRGGAGFGDAERLLGEILAQAPTLRAAMTLATKGGISPPAPYDSSPEYLSRAVDASLGRLGIEQIDLYQIHRPDILAHPQEVARALEDMVTSGKVRAVGVSNYTVDQAEALAGYLSIPLASHQPEFSPLHLDPLSDGLLDHAMSRQMAVLAWSPLGGGRIVRADDDRGRAIATVLDEKAQQCDVSREAVTYSWIMSHPARVIPIVGTQNEQRLGEVKDAFRVTWTRQDWYDVLTAARGERLP